MQTILCRLTCESVWHLQGMDVKTTSRPRKHLGRHEVVQRLLCGPSHRSGFQSSVPGLYTVLRRGEEGGRVVPPCSLRLLPQSSPTQPPYCNEAQRRDRSPKISCCHIRWFASHSSAPSWNIDSSRCHHPLATSASSPTRPWRPAREASPEMAATRPAHPLPDWACF